MDITSTSARAFLACAVLLLAAALREVHSDGTTAEACSGFRDDNGYCANPDADGSPRELPLQFTASVNVTSHRVDRGQVYPPGERRFQVWFDQPAGRFRAEALHSSETVIRRFDKGYELLVTRAAKSVLCSQSRLTNPTMQSPEWPSQAVVVGQRAVLGRTCNHWQQEQPGGSQVLDLFVDAESGAPVQVQASTWETDRDGRVLVADITYTMWNVKLQPPSVASFKTPKDVKGGLASCERAPNDIGFPYIHFFHFIYRA